MHECYLCLIVIFKHDVLFENVELAASSKFEHIHICSANVGHKLAPRQYSTNQRSGDVITCMQYAVESYNEGG
jgi:hypothetical protein